MKIEQAIIFSCQSNSFFVNFFRFLNLPYRQFLD